MPGYDATETARVASTFGPSYVFTARIRGVCSGGSRLFWTRVGLGKLFSELARENQAKHTGISEKVN